MPDDFPDGIFQESFVGGGGEFALPVFASCLTDSLRLWIGTDGRGREQRQIEGFLLFPAPIGIRAFPVEHLWGDVSAPSADGGIKRFHVEVSAFDGQSVFVEALRRPLAVDRLPQQGDLAALLNGKGHPVPDFGIETGFQFQINGHMQQRGA